METDEDQKDYEQEKFYSLSILTPLKLMRTKRGWNGEKRREVVYFQYTRHGKRQGIEEETCKRTRVPKRLVGYHDLGALNALGHPPGFLAVRLSPQEP
jgi:hypothetical protein